MSVAHRSSVPVAVVGVSALFPGSTDARGFWADILAGRDLVTDVPASHWLIEDYYDPNPSAPDKTYSKRGAFLRSIDFDPMEFGVPPSIVPATDTAQILALIVAQKVLDDASQGQFANMDRERMSIMLGVTSGQELLGTMVSRLQRPVWLKALRDSGIDEPAAQAICEKISASYVPWQESSFPGLLGNVVAGRIANRFDLRGTNCVTDAACASSLASLSMAVNELALGQSDIVITGGVDTMNDIFMYMCFSKTPALSPTGDCRPFSDAADGTLLGEGISMIALKRLEDAERDGDRVYAVIRGVGSASDGRSKSVYAPLPEGQARALRRTYEVAGYNADTVELVEAHGTGTKAGDAAEFEGLQTAFNETGRADRQWCALGSVKSQIGHTKATAGAAGMFKAVMALHHKVLPPTIKVARPNPNLAIENSPFYLNTKARPWIRDASHPRRASVSSFGFGGSNFHVALEEYVPSPGSKAKPAWQMRSVPSELVLLSASTGAELAKKCRELAESVTDLALTARESQANFRPTDASRLAIVTTSDEHLRTSLAQAAAAIEKAPTTTFSTPTGIHYVTGERKAGGVAFLFPGQGSQYVGMGADLAMTFEPARSAWDAAAGVRFEGQAVHELTFPRPVFDEASTEAQTLALTATEWAQPALGVSSAAMLRLLTTLGVKADCVAGHSFGEVTALHAAGAIDEVSLLKIARRRGELMRDAAAVPGAMIAVTATAEDVKAWLAKHGGSVVIANHNAPTQVVLSGDVASIEKVEQAMTKDGLSTKRLPVATAFHSSLVATSSAPLHEFLRSIEVKSPALDVYGNADATPYPTDADAIRERLATQLAKPVRFVDQIEAMYAKGVRTFVEVGAGSVLSDLVGRILGDRPHLAVSLDRKGRNGVTALQEGLGRLALGGLDLKLDTLWADVAPAPIKAKKKPAMAMPINGSNYGKPYPPPGGASALPPPNPVRAPLAAAPGHASSTASSNGSSGSHISIASAAPSAPSASAAPARTAMSASHGSLGSPASSGAPSAGGSSVASAPSTNGVSAPRSAPRTSSSVASPAASTSASRTASLEVPSQASTTVPQGARASQILAPSSASTEVRTVTKIPAGTDVHLAWVQAYQDAQRQTAEAHGAYQRAMADSHIAFLQASESSLAGLTALVTGQLVTSTSVLTPSVTRQPAPLVTSTPMAYAPTPQSAVAPAHLDDAPGGATPAAPKHVANAPAQVGEAPRAVAHAAPTPVAKVHTPAPTSASSVVSHTSTPAHVNGAVAAQVAAPTPRAAAAPSIDLEALMLTIVAEKTGYPAEMLGADMELESDLGIDSIKRVEILAAMRERAPGLPEVKPNELAKLRTLGQIVDHLRASVASAAPASTASANVGTEGPSTTAASSPGLDLEALMLTIVAEKTGYPAEMLGADMELEADLGIDSIKRVEILAAMRERAPGLPEVKPNELAKLRTLGQIVAHLRASVGSTAPVAASASVVSEAPVPAASVGVDLEALMMAIVAEKTGYPAEMLGADMELEADLGIDSIKRVEILAAMRERAPGLPEVKPNELAKLRTLGQIVGHMRASIGESMGATSSPAPRAAATSAATSSTTSSIPAASIDLEALMLTIVAEKTGYPAEMLGADMELEADLGIDSIKRVEILAAMRERAPGLPEVKPNELAKLRTLGQIVGHMRGAMGGPGSSSAHVGERGMSATPNGSTMSPSATIAAPSAVSASTAPSASVGRFATREVAAPAIGMAMGGLSAVRGMVVTDEGTGVAARVVAGLAQHGVAATVVSEVPPGADGVIFLGGLRGVGSIDEAIAVNREAFRAAKAVAPRLATEGGVFVTVQDTGGDFGLAGSTPVRAWLAGVAALTRTTAREWTRASVKAIDCERGDRSAESIAAAIVHEILEGGTTLEVGLRANGSRTTLTSVAAAAEPGKERVDQNSILVVSGGARGVTAAAVIALAEAHRASIVLLGRTPLDAEPAACAGVTDEPGLKRALLTEAQHEGRKITPAEIGAKVMSILAVREIHATLEALSRADSRAHYLSVDVQDAASLGEALAGIRKDWGGPITGIIHGAGVLADRAIAEKTQEQFDRVFDTKVAGLRALLEATANDPLEVICMFSSVAARAGNAGQCDYAMANEVLNAVACAEAAKRGDTCAVRSIGWGPWEGGMVTPALEKHFRDRGVALIPLASGARALVDELDATDRDVLTVIGGDASASALGAPSEIAARVEVHVSAASHPYLADHRIAGVAVVPVVLAAEWLVRAAEACRPDLTCSVIRDLKVMRGIKLDRFDTTGHWLTARCKQVSNGRGAVLVAELRGHGDALHYSATIEMVERSTATRAGAAGAEPTSLTKVVPYDGKILFHGPQFQVIRALDGVSESGAIATLARTADMAWAGSGWRTDPAAFDGALQLALLWADRVLGGASLPMSVAEIRLYGLANATGSLRAILRKREVRESRSLSDVSFVDASGTVVAEMIGVETVLLPGVAASTTRATPVEA